MPASLLRQQLEIALKIAMTHAAEIGVPENGIHVPAHIAGLQGCIALSVADGPPSGNGDDPHRDEVASVPTAPQQCRGRGRPPSTCIPDILRLMCDGRPRNKSQIIRDLDERGKEHGETTVRNALTFLTDPAHPAMHFDGQRYRMPD